MKYRTKHYGESGIMTVPTDQVAGAGESGSPHSFIGQFNSPLWWTGVTAELVFILLY